MVTDAAWPGLDQRPWGPAPAAGPLGQQGRPSAPDPWGLVCCFPSLERRPCAMSWASFLLFTSVPVRCVVLPVRCPGPLGSSSPVCSLGALCCVCGVLGHLAPVHRCAPPLRSVACVVSWATWLLCIGVPARCGVLCVRFPRPLGSCSPVRKLRVLCCVCGDLGHLAPVYRCTSSVCCLACAVSWATWLLLTGAPARCVVLRVRCPGPLGFRSPACPLGVLWCVCTVMGHLPPVHRCARSVGCVACAVSWATWLLFTSVLTRCVVLRVWCPGPFDCCAPVCPLSVLCCVCGVLGHLAPDHQCVPAQCALSRVRCTGPLGSCSPVWLLGALFCVRGVLGHLAPVFRRALLVRGVECAVSRATWRLFTSVPARGVVLRVRCPRPLGSCSPVCPLAALSRVCGVLGKLAPVHRCTRSLRCVACSLGGSSCMV